MNKVLFYLKRGHRIGNYRLAKRLGTGWTAEAYLAKEVPTDVARVLKLYGRFEDSQQIRNLRDFEHYCWFLEQISSVEILPRYYHMGHIFLKVGDGIGHYYMVQEYLKGKPFKASECNELMVRQFCKKVAKVHKLGYALGDFNPENLILTKGGIRMVDCNYGKHDKPNTDAKTDFKEMASIFGKLFVP